MTPRWSCLSNRPKGTGVLEGVHEAATEIFSAALTAVSVRNLPSKAALASYRHLEAPGAHIGYASHA